MNKLIFTLLLVFSIQWVAAQDFEAPETQFSIVTKHTATWCPNCGTTAWDIFKDVVDNVTSNAIIVAAHRSRSSDLYSKVGEDFLSNMPGVVYQPEFFVNEEKMSGGFASLADNIKDKVMTNAQESPLVQSGIQLLVNEDGSGPLQINTKTRFFKNANGTYYLAVWLIEEEVVADQASRGNNVTHQQVLKKAITQESFGFEIASGAIEAGTELEHSFEYEMEEGEEIKNLEIAVTLWEFDGNGYYFVNGNSSTSFSTITTTSVNQLEGMLESFTVSPNLINNEAIVELQLKERLTNAQLGLYNLNGQLIEPVFSGELESGVYRFALDASSVAESGLYLMNLSSREGIVSRKVVIR